MNVMHCSFDACDTDKVPKFKRLLQEEQNTREKVLKDILKSKTNGHRADSEQFNQIGVFEGWSDNGECDRETQRQDAGLNQSSHQQCDPLMLLLPLYPTPRERLAACRRTRNAKK